MLFEKNIKSFAHSPIHHTFYFVVTELGLGLPLELGLGNFDGNNRRNTFAEVIGRYFDFGLLQKLVVVGIFFERTRQCRTEARNVRTSLYRIDIIYIRMQILCI